MHASRLQLTSQDRQMLLEVLCDVLLHGDCTNGLRERQSESSWTLIGAACNRTQPQYLSELGPLYAAR
jgi:hypothetical protein